MANCKSALQELEYAYYLQELGLEEDPMLSLMELKLRYFRDRTGLGLDASLQQMEYEFYEQEVGS